MSRKLRQNRQLDPLPRHKGGAALAHKLSETLPVTLQLPKDVLTPGALAKGERWSARRGEVTELTDQD